MQDEDYHQLCKFRYVSYDQVSHLDIWPSGNPPSQKAQFLFGGVGLIP
jgi:hypothetical protein